MKAESYTERRVEIDGWQVRVATYKAGTLYRARVESADPGATLARAAGATAEEAEAQAIQEARSRLARTRRQQV